MVLPSDGGAEPDSRFALIIDRVELDKVDVGGFMEQMAVFRDHCGADAVLVSEHDIELDSDPVAITDLPPATSPVIARIRELRERLAAREASRG